jgi:hypothetical protein
MAFHLPAHPIHVTDHHVLRNMLLAIVLAAVAIVVIYAAATTQIGTTVHDAHPDRDGRMIEFRAGSARRSRCSPSRSG